MSMSKMRAYVCELVGQHKHSAGPWGICRAASPGPREIIEDANGMAVAALTSQFAEVERSEEAAANAALIAAAPSLLEALEAQIYANECETSQEAWAKIMQMSHRAIARAHGAPEVYEGSGEVDADDVAE